MKFRLLISVCVVAMLAVSPALSKGTLDLSKAIIPLGLMGKSISQTPTFIGNSAGNDNSGGTTTTLAVTLPTRAVNDMLIAFVGTGGGASAPTISASAGWTLIGTPVSATTRGIAVAYRIATNNASDALTWTASVACFMTTVMAVFRNTHTSAAAEAGVAVSTLNPPAITPSWGTLINMYVAMMACNSTGTFTSHPSGYTAIINFTPATTSTTIPMVAMSYLVAISSTEDAGTFGVTSSGNGVANSAAVRPAPS